ncbi:MAG: lasso peptide biosynthesis B2 protein [Anaerolineales bacterium]
MWKSFRHRLQTARQLTWRDWLGLAQAWWILLAFYWMVRWLSLERLEALTRLAPGGTAAALPDALAWARQRQKWISLAARLHPLPMTCLPRAIGLRWLLSRRRIAASLRIGMSKTATGMIAHAWVEVAGEAIGEPEDLPAHFTVLAPH